MTRWRVGDVCEIDFSDAKGCLCVVVDVHPTGNYLRVREVGSSPERAREIDAIFATRLSRPAIRKAIALHRAVADDLEALLRKAGG